MPCQHLHDGRLPVRDEPRPAATGCWRRRQAGGWPLVGPLVGSDRTAQPGGATHARGVAVQAEPQRRAHRLAHPAGKHPVAPARLHAVHQPGQARQPAAEHHHVGVQQVHHRRQRAGQAAGVALQRGLRGGVAGRRGRGDRGAVERAAVQQRVVAREAGPADECLDAAAAAAVAGAAAGLPPARPRAAGCGPTRRPGGSGPSAPGRRPRCRRRCRCPGSPRRRRRSRRPRRRWLPTAPGSWRRWPVPPAGPARPPGPAAAAGRSGRWSCSSSSGRPPPVRPACRCRC